MCPGISTATSAFGAQKLASSWAFANLARGDSLGENSLEKHHPVSGQLDGDNIASFGLRVRISQAIDEINAMILVGWQHAASLHADGQQNKPEDYKTSHHQNQNPPKCVARISADD